MLLHQQSEIEIYKPFYIITLAKNLVMEVHNVENQGTTSRQLLSIASKIANGYKKKKKLTRHIREFKNC